MSDFAGNIFSDDTFSGSTATVETPTETASPAPDGDFTGGESTFTENYEENDFTATDTAQDTAPEFALPENDDDLKEYEGLPLAQTLAQTRAHARELATKQAEFAALQEKYSQYGEPDEVTRAMEVYRGFFTPMTDPQTGAVIYHPETNLPLYTAKPALEKLAMTSPGRILGLIHDLNQMKDEHGNGFVERFLTDGLKINPAEFQDFLAGKLGPKEGARSATPTIHPDDAAWLKQTYGENAVEAFAEHIDADDWADFWEQAANNPDRAQKMMNRALKQFGDAKELATIKEQMTQIQTHRQEAQAQEERQFSEQVQKASVAYIAELQTTEIDKIVQDFNTQWSFSQDEARNKAAVAQIEIALNAIVDPANEKLASKVAQALGLTLPQDFYKNLELAATKAAEIKRWESINEHPRFRQYRDDAALAAAKGQLESSLRIIRPVLKGIGAKIARNMGATAKHQSEIIAAQAKAGMQRPAVTGSAPKMGATSRPMFGTNEGWAEIGL